jgi:hypothetical protein
MSQRITEYSNSQVFHQNYAKKSKKISRKMISGETRCKNGANMKT